MLSVEVVKRRGDFTLRAAFQAPIPGIVALFGRSGCGKTTLIDILAGLLEPDEGSARLDDFDLLHARAEHRRVGYVFQDARLFPHYDVAGNLRYGLKRAGRADRSIGFDKVVTLLGLAPLLSRKPGQLSGGERQRVALGRALLSQPRLLLLDEPLAALDAARREEVMLYFEALRDRLAIPMVYVSHQLDEVLRLASHVVLLDDGHVVVQGSPREVSLNPQLSAVIGREAMGAVLEGIISAIDVQRGLAELRVGRGKLHICATGMRIGAKARVQLLARDIILSTESPRALSVRNAIEGRIENIAHDDAGASLIHVNIGDAIVLSRVTNNAVEELGLHRGMNVWALVKAVSTRIL